jgi:DNA adenine methylase
VRRGLRIPEASRWADAVEKCASPDTVFYCDPPYVDKQDYYPVEDIDHEELLATLGECEGAWYCSYADLPANADEFEVVAKDSRNYINNGTSGSTNETTEHLIHSAGLP